MGSHSAPRRRVWNLPPDGFRELRRSCLLGRKTCADLLGCSLSAVRAWDRGTHRVPWSAVKLLRLYRQGDLGALRHEWRGWTLNRNGLVSPEGLVYARSDLGWWSLTCRQAEAFRRGPRQRATGGSVPEPPGTAVEASVSVGELPGRSGRALGPSPLTALAAAVADAGSSEGAAPALQGGERSEPTEGAGLVYNSTSVSLSAEIKERCGFQPVEAASKWCHNDATSLPEFARENDPSHPAPAGSLGGGSGQRCQRPRDQPERVPDPRHPELGHLPEASYGGRGAACAADRRGSVSTSGPREGGEERSLPVRQRSQVEVLPRQAVGLAGGAGPA